MDITDKIDRYVDTIDEGVVENLYDKGMESLQSLTWRDVKYGAVEGFRMFADFAEASGLEDGILDDINQQLGTNFTSLEAIANLRILESELREGGGSQLMGKISPKFKKLLGTISKVTKGHKKSISASKVFLATVWIMMASGKMATKKVKGVFGG